jgi:hypothetical protein
VQALLERAKAAGYNGVILNDPKLSSLDLLGVNAANYLQHVAMIKRKADQLGIRIISGLTNPGSGAPMLAHDPNLAEGILVKDVPYRVKNRVAALEQDPSVALANGAFDQGDKDRLDGFNTQDAVGTGTFMDREIRRQGKGSLRMERFPEINKPNGMVRITQQVAVRPWRQYRLSAYIRTQDLDPTNSVSMLVKAADGRELAWAPRPMVKTTQDWNLVQTVFPSMESDHVTIFFGVWGGKAGKIWWADGALEEAGLVNVVRRSACPLVVTGGNGQTYIEGKDFEPFSDPKLGNQPWPGSYSDTQPSPTLQLTHGSRIGEGERLLVSGYIAKILGFGQVAASLGDEGFFQLYQKEIAAQANLLQPAGFLLGHDEIRVINQDPASTSRHLGAGGLLAMNIDRCANLIRKAEPKADIFIWSDMFTPTQNAHAGYYLVGGDLTGSWKGIPKDAIVLNWDSVKPQESAAFFSGLGLHQILAGYYDKTPGDITGWLRQVRANKGIVGVMYTTWEDKFEDLEAFAKAAWGQP